MMSSEEIIRQALAEDLGEGDHTSLATIPATARGEAFLLVKEEGVLAGIDIARRVFHAVDEALQFTAYFRDGQPIKKGDVLFELSGSARAILAGERLALNFLQRMSGIATHTARLVALCEGSGVKLLDTRKTTPLLRLLEKQAVKAGGGFNHRFGLYDMMMIKDNHIDFAGGIAPAIEAALSYLKKENKDLRIEIEVRNMVELREVLRVGGIHRIMLDNFSPAELKEAVRLVAGRYETEASGGITAETLADYAATGVDFISVGALTHQIKSLDLSLIAKS